MSEVSDPTQPLSESNAEVGGAGRIDAPAAREREVTTAAPGAVRERRDPVAAFRGEDNRIKLLLVIAGLQVLAIVLLAAVLVSVRAGGVGEQVDVEGQPCVVVDEDDGNALYCRR